MAVWRHHRHSSLDSFTRSFIRRRRRRVILNKKEEEAELEKRKEEKGQHALR